MMVVALYSSAPCEAVGVRPIECAVGFHFDVAFTRCLRYLQVHKTQRHNYLLQRLSTCSMYRHQVRTADGIVRCCASCGRMGCRGYVLALPLSVRLSLSCSSSTSTISISIVLYPLPALVWMQFTTSLRLRFTMLPCLSRLRDSPYIVLLIFVHNYLRFDSCVMSYADGGRDASWVIHRSVLA